MKSRDELPFDTFERRFVKPREGRTLIVGSKLYGEREDRRKRYPDAVGIDMLEGDGVDVVADLEIGVPQGIGRFDHVECLSVLEHSRAPWKLAHNIEKMMRPGASLFVSAPFVWRRHGYPSDYWRFTAEAIPVLFESVNWLNVMYASRELKRGVMGFDGADGHPCFPRAEVLGFGVKK